MYFKNYFATKQDCYSILYRCKYAEDFFYCCIYTLIVLVTCDTFPSIPESSIFGSDYQYTILDFFFFHFYVIFMKWIGLSKMGNMFCFSGSLG